MIERGESKEKDGVGDRLEYEGEEGQGEVGKDKEVYEEKGRGDVR